ncbi:MAG: ATP-binding cassette domain-containing protein, partial [Bacteroidota bacterium]
FRAELNLSPGKLASIIGILFGTSFYLWGASKQAMDVFLNLSRINQSLERLYYAEENEIQGVKKDVLINDITIKNLNFFFGERKIIKNLSIKIPIGTKVCIMGPSGSGKTTLLNILAKMCAVEDGMIFINDLDINKIDEVYYRKNLSYITQSNFMFHTSIFENISIGKEGATLEEVIEATKKAKIHDFIINLPDEYNSDVGVNSSFFSGGQIQRICIARALLNKANIIICDEPTSSIDKIASVDIIQNIVDLSKGKTLIWVDHSTLVSQFMDMIIFFQKNKEIVIGSHNDLLINNGEYRVLFEYKR